MDNVSIWFVLLLVVISGVIAAVGDWLGRKLGKKRLKVGRLRPKHTAILMTFIAGMVITVLTILSLSLMSRQVRTWLVEGSRLEQQLQETRAQVDAGQREIDGVRTQLGDEQKKLAEETKRVADATADAERLAKEASSLKGEVTIIKQQLAVSKRQVTTVQNEYRRLEADSKMLAKNNSAFETRNSELMRQNVELMSQIATITDQIDSLQTKVNTLEADVTKAEQEKLTATESFNAERRRIDDALSLARNELSQTQSNLADARTDLALVLAQRDQVVTESVVSRFNKLIYNRSDELARLSVRSRLSQAEAKAFLDNVMDAASRDASQRGAIRDPDSRNSAAFGDYDNGPSAQEQYNTAVGAIAGSESDQVIIARAMTNAFTGEWVRVKVDVFKNPLVYHEGDLIIETRVDGRRGVQGVTQQIIEAIGKQMRERAIKDGMIPALGRQPELGEISQEELQRIVADTVAADRTISMRIHSARDARASDTIQLDIRLR